MPEPRSEPRPKGLADIGAEAALILGGGRAILLQLANPAVGVAVARHSDFAADPLRRLRHTLTFVYAVTSGTPEQADAARRMVDAAHSSVQSTAEERPAYDARDAGLQLWVAATLYDSAMAVQDRLLDPLTEADRDRVYAEYAVVGTALQMPPELWPADRRSFAEYWARQSAALAVGDEVRGVADRLLHPKAAPWWVRAGMPLVGLITAGLLGPELRDQYRLPWSPARERHYELAMTVIAAAYRLLPRGIRHWPKRRLLRDLDRRLGAH